MAKKIDFRAAVSSAAQEAFTQTSSKFARAKATLEQFPTGFTEVIDGAITEKVEQGAPTVFPRLGSDGGSSFTRETVLAVQSATPSRLGTPVYAEVPLDLIDDNPYNARFIYKPEKVAELARSMAADGQLIPGLAAKRGDRYILIAAHYRKKAAKLASLPVLKLMVYEDLSDQDLYLLSYKENAEHNEQTPLDNAMAWRRVVDEGVYESELALAEALGMSKANISKTLAILKLDRPVLEIVEQAPESFALSVLYELTLLQRGAGVEVTVDMASRVLSQGIGRKEIAMARERAESSPGASGRKRVNETSRSYRIWNQSTKIGQIREWDSGKVAVEVNFPDEKQKAQFIEEMRQRFSSADSTRVDDVEHE